MKGHLSGLAVHGDNIPRVLREEPVNVLTEGGDQGEGRGIVVGKRIHGHRSGELGGRVGPLRAQIVNLPKRGNKVKNSEEDQEEEGIGDRGRE